jgi:hypothetical protein
MKEEELLEQQTGQEPTEEAPPAEPVLMRRELEAERQALEAEKAAFARQKLENAVSRELVGRGLPGEMAQFLTGTDEEQSLENVEQFECLFREGLAKAITQRMRGAGAPREPARSKGYSRDTLRGMSASEINAHWDEVSRALRG